MAHSVSFRCILAIGALLLSGAVHQAQAVAFGEAHTTLGLSAPFACTVFGTRDPSMCTSFRPPSFEFLTDEDFNEESAVFGTVDSGIVLLSDTQLIVPDFFSLFLAGDSVVQAGPGFGSALSLTSTQGAIVYRNIGTEARTLRVSLELDFTIRLSVDNVASESASAHVGSNVEVNGAPLSIANVDFMVEAGPEPIGLVFCNDGTFHSDPEECFPPIRQIFLDLPPGSETSITARAFANASAAVQGQVIPEPDSALLALGALVACFFRCKRVRH